MRKSFSFGAFCALAFSAAASAQNSATTQLSDVAAMPLSSGGKAALTYRVTHDFHAPTNPGTPLPGARIARSDHASAFDGVWGPDAGEVGAWLTPQRNFFFQFGPTSTFIENTYFTNRVLSSSAAVALPAGDRFELFMANMLGNAPLPFDRERGVAGGSVAWDYAGLARQVSAKHYDDTATSDVLFFRADLVARGGDVDARSDSIGAPPLIIDLPRTYAPGTQAMYITTTFLPYTAYIASFDLEVLPELGKAILRGSVKGYVHEAREYTLPGGAQMNEWHLPLMGVIMIIPPELPVGAQLMMRAPEGGVALASDGTVAERWSIPAGGVIQTAFGQSTQLQDSAGAAVPREEALLGEGAGDESSMLAAASSSVLTDELSAVAPINASLSSPADLVLGDRTYGLTIDPDFRAEGVLALRNVRKAASGTRYADVISIPYAVIDGAPIKLTRDRLVDLRVLPVYQAGSVIFSGQAGEPPLTETRRLKGNFFYSGLTVDAVYDLGNRRYAFLEFVGAPDRPGTDQIASRITVRSLDSHTVQTVPVQYLELPENGPVNDGTTLQTNEFSAPIDINSSASKELTLANHRIAPSILRSGTDGILTVLSSPAALTASPLANNAESIVGKPLAFYYTTPPGTFTQSSLVNTVLLSDGPAAIPNPLPIGEVCGEPQVVDGSDSDAPTPDLDIKRAWLDADNANLYATIQVANVPTAAPAGNNYTWAMFWRYDHGGRYMRARLDANGQWRFDTGGFNSNTFFFLRNVTGETQPGANGYIRIAVPRDFLRYRDGSILRETSAHSYLDSTVDLDADQAPDNTPDEPTYGTGGDYVVGPSCGTLPVQLDTVVSRKAHGSIGSFDVQLPLTGTPAVESRSGGASGDHTLVFTFANPLFRVEGASVSAGVGVVRRSGIDEGDPRNYVVELTGVSNAQTIAVSLANITDASGNKSDVVSASMGVLVGDSNEDRAVNSGDAQQTRNRSGQTADADNFRSDVNADGAVNSGDAFIVRRQSGTGLAP